MKMPFIFARLSNPEDWNCSEIRDWAVDITTSQTFKTYDARWMCDENFGSFVLVPDVDITEETFFFDSYEDAYNFVRDWWKLN